MSKKNTPSMTTAPPAATSEDILAALPAELVIQLARLAGKDLESLSVTFAFMSYPYRAALATYDLIEMSPAVEGENRNVAALPLSIEVAAAAAKHLADMADPANVAASFAATGTGRTFIPTVPTRDAGSQRIQGDDEVFVPIVVVSSEPNGPKRRTVVATLVHGDDWKSSPGTELTRLSFVTDAESDLQTDARASLVIQVDEALRLGVVSLEPAP